MPAALWIVARSISISNFTLLCFKVVAPKEQDPPSSTGYFTFISISMLICQSLHISTSPNFAMISMSSYSANGKVLRYLITEDIKRHL
ncbi:hypothetical protein J3F83DRAFT_739091 [Trichoderma novae-zelandiae]